MKRNILIIIPSLAFIIFYCQKKTSPAGQLGEVGDPCTTAVECMEGLTCAHDGTCQDRAERERGSAGPGDRCDEQVQCSFGLSCCDGELARIRGCSEGICVELSVEGEGCGGSEDCDIGLSCGTDGICGRPGVEEKGARCTFTQDCIYGLVCSSDGKCVQPGEGAPGDSCEGEQDCLYELVCAGDGTCQDPQEPSAQEHGIGAQGDECDDSSECQMGMSCYMGAECRKVPYWAGVNCYQPTQEEYAQMEFKVYFEIPSLPIDHEIEFYRLPFPNDIRVRNGKVQLDGHPAPPSNHPGGVVVRRYLDAIDNHYDGFSTQPTVLLRFSKPLDFDTIRLSTRCHSCASPDESPPQCPSGCERYLYRNFYLVNITPPADPEDTNYVGYGEGVNLAVAMSTGRGRYICHNWLALRPADGFPLRAGVTYAVVVTDTRYPADGIKSADGESLVADEDFAKLIEGLASGDCAGASQGDENVASACQLPAYQYLASYLNDENTPDYDPEWRKHVKAAAVFTTMKPVEPFGEFREKIFNCEGADCSNLPAATPDGDSGRNTALSTDKYRVYEGKMRMPIFQSGQPPYLEEGEGRIQYDSRGFPVINDISNERVALADFTLAVPDRDLDYEQGWPVVIFMHDVSEQSGESASAWFIEKMVAQNLSSVEIQLGELPDTYSGGFAVVSVTRPLHGPRRGDEVQQPAYKLFYNFDNPYVLRDTIVQSAAEVYQIIRFIQTLHATYMEGGSFTGLEGINLDPENIYLMGIGEGARSAIIASAFEPLIKSIVISQIGGPFYLNLLKSSAPFDFKGSIEIMVEERGLGSMNPIVSLLQMFFDPVDVTNFGKLIISNPPRIGETEGDPPQPILGGPHHLFMVYGRDDSRCPEQSIEALITTFGIAQFDNDTSDCGCGKECDLVDERGYHRSVCTIGGITTIEGDIRGNMKSGTVTGVVTMFALSMEGSAHDALFDSEGSIFQYRGFLASSFFDPEAIPTVFAL